MNRRIPIAVLVGTVSLLPLVFPLASATASEPMAPLEGQLSILWGDGPGVEPPGDRKFILTDDAGKSLSLWLGEEVLRFGAQRWNGQRVRVYPAAAGETFTADGRYRVGLIQLAEKAVRSKAVVGSQPWISILCKFADVSAEPENLLYFQEMYANAPGRLDHYWREVSAGAVNLLGSVAIGWVTLPGNQKDYAPTPGAGTNADLNAVFDDCTGLVDDIIDFSGGGLPFAGINLMVNGNLDCCAWGGGRFATLDGVTKSWRTTWNPPWAFGNVAIIAHEMGHGFGLPHANNFDGDGNPYDSPWDVMSSATGYAANDATYGALGKHVNAYHKDALGWFPTARRFEAPPASTTTLELDDTALASPTHHQVAVIPTEGAVWYTVEARYRTGGYDSALPGDAVIIHEVDPGRSEPSWAVDGDVPPADFSDNPGTMWLPGEIFLDAANDLAVSVENSTSTGFVVTIHRGFASVVFSNGFESGDSADWSNETP